MTNRHLRSAHHGPPAALRHRGSGRPAGPVYPTAVQAEQMLTHCAHAGLCAAGVAPALRSPSRVTAGGQRSGRHGHQERREGGGDAGAAATAAREHCTPGVRSSSDIR
ncbi:hypothetical protein GCM10022384_08310 [Streptomyces marokkonensis]|uniref:Uncharacterized protein n=1 Tax=Streptomyces marokkonensis TaxID=324855 RepID=A0ABP7P0C3_9ACTN